MFQNKKVTPVDACLDTFQDWVGSDEVLRSTFLMTTIAERGMIKNVISTAGVTDKSTVL